MPALCPPRYYTAYASARMSRDQSTKEENQRSPNTGRVVSSTPPAKQIELPADLPAEQGETIHRGKAVHGQLSKLMCCNVPDLPASG